MEKCNHLVHRVYSHMYLFEIKIFNNTTIIFSHVMLIPTHDSTSIIISAFLRQGEYYQKDEREANYNNRVC